MADYNLLCNQFRILCDRPPRMGRAGFNSNQQIAALISGFPRDNLDVPYGFVEAIALVLADDARPQRFVQTAANVVISHVAGLIHRQVPASRLSVEDCLHFLDDLPRLEGLAVVLENLIVNREAGLGPQMTRELAGVV